MDLMKRQFLAATALLSLFSSAHGGETELYSLQKSISGKQAPWSGKQLQTKLDPGKKGKLQFKLGELPKHQFLKLDLELQIGGGMDFGSIIVQGMNQDGAKPSKEAKDRLKITTIDGLTLLDSSFSSSHLGQSFPDAFGSFSHKPGTGAVDAKQGAGNGGGIAGFFIGGNDGASSGRYNLELVFPHDSEAVALQLEWLKGKIEGKGIEGIMVQMAGGMLGGDAGPYTVLDLTLSAIDGEPESALDAKIAAALLDAVASDKPLAAHAALQKIIRAGDSALPFIRQRFAIQPDPDLEAKFREAAEALGSDVFRERAKAEADIGAMGVDALPLVIAKLTGDGTSELTPDVRTTMQKIKKKLQEGAKASSDQALANRLRQGLALSKSEQAKKTLAALPPLKKLMPYVAPDKPPGFDDEGIDIDFDFQEFGELPEKP